MLPGFAVEKLGSTQGFVSSLTVGPDGNLYYSTTSGKIFRFDGSASEKIAEVPSASEGNAALLGIAFRGPDELIAHYVKQDLTADIVASIDLASGGQEVLAEFICDGGRPCSTEHHGGNPMVAPDYSIFVGIGDYGGGSGAQMPDTSAGKIFRIRSSTDIEMYALGVRNPFDMVFDETTGELLVGDNGAEGRDELNAVAAGENCGWPFDIYDEPPLPDSYDRPIYRWHDTIAPTGMLYVRGPMPMPRHGVIVGSFVTAALYYFPDVTLRPMPDPIVLIADETPAIIDIAQASDGTIYFATGLGIYRLRLPMRGDANGNGKLDSDDVDAIRAEIDDGGDNRTIFAATGDHAASWGADMNVDGVIDALDLAMVAKVVSPRRRPAGRGVGDESGQTP